MPKITPNVKNAFNPIPGASAIGQLAHKPMINVPTTAAIIVAVNTAPNSMPEPSVLKIAGFTTVMYAIVKKVARPAITSLRTVVPAFFRPNRFSNMITPFVDKPIYCCQISTIDSQPPYLVADSMLLLRVRQENYGVSGT